MKDFVKPGGMGEVLRERLLLHKKETEQRNGFLVVLSVSLAYLNPLISLVALLFIPFAIC